MKVALYAIDVIYLFTAFAFSVLFFTMRPWDLGFLILAGICGGSAIISLYFLSWWPLVAGGILSGGILFLGSGGLFDDKADKNNVF